MLISGMRLLCRPNRCNYHLRLSMNSPLCRPNRCNYRRHRRPLWRTSLSLMVAGGASAPTPRPQPLPPLRGSATKMQALTPSSIEELNTVPPPASGQRHVRVPGANKHSLVRQPQPVGMALARPQTPHPLPSRTTSDSAYTRQVAERKVGRPIAWADLPNDLPLTHAQAHFRAPGDRLRWWLLKPGRIEFILWIVGTLLLMTITLSLLFAAAISLAWIVPGQHKAVPTVPVRSNSYPGSGPGSSSSMKLTLIGTNSPVPGVSLSMQGQGFTQLGTIMLTHDQNQPCSPNSIKADTLGTFTVMINDASWLPGKHRISATDQTSGHSVTLTVMLASLTATPTLNSTSTPGTTNGTGNQPPPVNVAPSPVPTQQTTPSPSPAPSPTAGITPTPGVTPTVGITPTVSPTP